MSLELCWPTSPMQVHCFVYIFMQHTTSHTCHRTTVSSVNGQGENLLLNCLSACPFTEHLVFCSQNTKSFVKEQGKRKGRVNDRMIKSCSTRRRSLAVLSSINRARILTLHSSGQDLGLSPLVVTCLYRAQYFFPQSSTLKTIFLIRQIKDCYQAPAPMTHTHPFWHH